MADGLVVAEGISSTPDQSTLTAAAVLTSHALHKGGGWGEGGVGGQSLLLVAMLAYTPNTVTVREHVLYTDSPPTALPPLPPLPLLPVAMPPLPLLLPLLLFPPLALLPLLLPPLPPLPPTATLPPAKHVVTQ